LASEQDQRNHKRQLADQITASKGFHSEKETLQSKCNILEDESRLMERRIGELLEENSSLKKELDKNSSLLEENVHKYNTDLSNNQMNLLKQKNEFQHEVSEYQDKIAHSMSELKTSQEVVQSLRDRIAAQEKENSDKLRLASEDHWSKMSILEAEKSNTEKELVALKQKSGDLELQNEAMIKEQEREQQRLKKELQEALATIELLKDNDGEMRADKDHNSNALEQSRVRVEELGLLLQDSSNQIEGLKSKLNVMKEKNSSLESKAQSLSNDIEHLVEQASREAEAYEHTLERQNVL
jgi:chromosome segregation ATPase